jgi:hypothetical protein
MGGNDSGGDSFGGIGWIGDKIEALLDGGDEVEGPGVLPRSLVELFKALMERESNEMEENKKINEDDGCGKNIDSKFSSLGLDMKLTRYCLECSMIEIYMNNVFDLLSMDKDVACDENNNNPVSALSSSFLSAHDCSSLTTASSSSSLAFSRLTFNKKKTLLPNSNMNLKNQQSNINKSANKNVLNDMVFNNNTKKRAVSAGNSLNIRRSSDGTPVIPSASRINVDNLRDAFKVWLFNIFLGLYCYYYYYCYCCCCCCCC